MSVRLAVIGAGVMGADHARILAEDVPGCTLQVICDADGARARTVADATGAAHVDTDAMAALSRADVDAVLVASPDDTHTALTIACVEAGKPVLCEKPLAPGTEGCLEIVAAEVRAGRRLTQVGFMRRYDPSYTEMRAALVAGHIGKPLMMHNFHRNKEVPDWFGGTMAITNSAPHEFDIVRFVLGAELTHIAAYEPAAAPAGQVAPVVMVLGTDQGHLVTIEVNNNAAYGYDVRGELVGDAGSVCLNTPVASRLNARLAASEAYAADWRPRFAEAYRLQNKAWVQAAAAGTVAPGAADAWDGYVATAIGIAGAAALTTGARMPIPCADRPALYGSANA